LLISAAVGACCGNAAVCAENALREQKRLRTKTDRGDLFRSAVKFIKEHLGSGVYHLYFAEKWLAGKLLKSQD
jgi:hypothetical protein